ncbi:hypothetical protein G3M48_005419 [Beauveria asiatica]|uniref:CCHC-type domain-containing protein n=1 Tax=Beauveria asiatica TaxID=1069075 RepID=A0AAW0S609_9HYPO
MSQNNDSNNGSNNGAVGGRLVSRREEGEELVDFATALRGRFNIVSVNARPVAVSRNENIADSRASGSNVAAAAEAARDALVQAREVPLDTEFRVVVSRSALTRFGGYPNEFIPIQPMDDDEFVPASNVQENRLSAPVQTVKQETQENRESAPVQTVKQETQENRESASGQQDTSTQDTSTGSQQWPEQTPSQYQLRLRQRRERHARREQEGQLRPRGAQQGRRDFGRRNPLQSTTEAVEAYAQKLREACESLNEADRMFNQLARANRGRGNRGLGAMAPIRIPESFRRAAARTQPNHGSIAASDAQQQRPSARPDARHQKPNDPRPNRGGNNVKICGNCGKDGHVLAQCVHPSEDGFVHGCSTCNKNDHESLDMCPFRPTNAIKLFTRAVLERQNRPPLAQYKDWIPLAEAVPAGRLPQAFPWMPGFLSTLLDLPAGSRPWDNFDYTRNDASSLPVDPSTASWAVIQQHKEMLRRVLLEAGMVNGGLCGAIGEEDFPSLETPMPHGESSGSHAGADVAQH